MTTLKQIKLYNSLTNREETLVPLEEGKISMYVCGPTVYNRPHIGNMRPIVVFDTLRRLLEFLGYKVTYVSNYTDVDDKIIDSAIKEGVNEYELSSRYIRHFEKVVGMIGSKLPTITPRVTQYIPQIIHFIDELVKNGSAYVTDSGVYFDVSKVKDYGSLSGISLENLHVGARIETSEEKKSPYDFALWKKTDIGIKWDSPWGEGRPGWHTECCVMIDSIFPRHFIDIHGGGYDLKFPHHENEIAQSEALNHNKIAQFWMHNAFINVENEKMSKSLGNVLYPEDLIAQYGGPVVRLVILSAHYRQPINFKDETINAAVQEFKKIETVIRQVGLYLQFHHLSFEKADTDESLNRFIDAMLDDLNTANALMEVYGLVKKINVCLRQKEVDQTALISMMKSLMVMLDILGINVEYTKLSPADLEIYEKYVQAKNNKDFALSDELRKQLIEKKII